MTDISDTRVQIILDLSIGISNYLHKHEHMNI